MVLELGLELEFGLEFILIFGLVLSGIIGVSEMAFGVLFGLFEFELVGPTSVSIIVSLLSLLYKYSKFLGVSKGV